MSVTNAISSESRPVVCAPDPLPQSPAHVIHVSPPLQVRSPQTGPPLLEDELLEELLEELLDDDDAAALLEDELELEDISPLLLMDPLLVEDAPLPLEVCPLEFVPVDVMGLPPVPPAPPRFSSSGLSLASLMTPVHALRTRTRAEKANRVRRCMTRDCTSFGIPIVTEKSKVTRAGRNFS